MELGGDRGRQFGPGRELNPRHADFQPLRPLPGNSAQKGTFRGYSKSYPAKSAVRG